MSFLKELNKRADSKCELFTSNEYLKEFLVLPIKKANLDESILACTNCISQIENPGTEDANHWRCLNDSMWNENIAVQIVSWRLLSRLQSNGWPKKLLDMMYFNDETLEYA